MSKVKSAVMLVAGLVAYSAVAEKMTIKGVIWTYSVSGDTACIEMHFGAEPNGKLNVPAKLGKYCVTSIGRDSLMGVDGPKVITIPESVTSIGSQAFSGNENLKSVALPPKLTSISRALFMGCEKLNSIKIPASVKSIGKEAFAECKGLKTVTIPEGVESIDKSAFRDCSNLVEVIIPTSVTNIDEMVFVRCGKLPKITVSKNNRAYANRREKDVAGALFTKDGTTLVAWPAGCATAAVKIPAGVTSISDFAFDGNRITSIAIPASVTNIGDGAFCNCPKLSIIYADAGDLDRLKSVIAVHNPKTGETVEGQHYKFDYREQMDKIKIEEKGKGKKK